MKWGVRSFIILKSLYSFLTSSCFFNISLKFSIFSLLTFSFLSGGIYNFTPTPQRSERERMRGRERESAQIHWDILIWLWLGFLGGMFFWGIWEMKFENLFILDSIAHCSKGWANRMYEVTAGWRSWCECQKCEMRERDEKQRVWVSELGEERERLTGECVLEEEWVTDIWISFVMWNHWIFWFTLKQCEVWVLIVYRLFWMDLLFILLLFFTGFTHTHSHCK